MPVILVLGMYGECCACSLTADANPAADTYAIRPSVCLSRDWAASYYLVLAQLVDQQVLDQANYAYECPMCACSSIKAMCIVNVFCAGWGQSLGYSVDRRRAEAFNTLVFGEIGYSITTRFIKASTFHPRVFKGNPW